MTLRSYLTREDLNMAATETSYEELFDDVQTLTDSTIDTTTKHREAAAVLNILDYKIQTEECYRNLDVVASDMFLVKASADIIYAEIVNSDANIGQYNGIEFVQKLLCQIGSEQPNWLSLFPYALSAIPGIIPPVSFMYGTFDYVSTEDASQPRERKQRERKQNTQENIVTLEPEEVMQTDQTQEDSAVLNFIFSSVKEELQKNQGQPICLIRFAVDPTSFSYTVDNMFRLSFLVNQGRIAIVSVEDDLFIKWPQKDRKEQGSSKDSNQFILSIDIQMWEFFVKSFKITEACINIPSRQMRSTL